jgi:hypothetical protein
MSYATDSNPGIMTIVNPVVTSHPYLLTLFPGSHAQLDLPKTQSAVPFTRSQ